MAHANVSHGNQRERTSGPTTANRRRLGLALSALTFWGCAEGPPGAAEKGLGTAASAVYGGTSDVDSRVPAVVQIAGCTGTLIAPNVVLTAAHCFTQVATRCAPYEYAQPLAPDAGAFKVTIPPIDPNSPPGQPKFLTDYDDTNSRKIDVLAIQPHPARIRNLVEDCCNGDVTTCSDVCTLKSGLKLGHRLHDLALAYLAEPVTDIAPMDVLLEVAASSETAVPSIGRYHVDWSALAGTLLGVAGTSASDGDTTGRDRVYGTVSLSSAAYPYPSDAPNQVSLTQFGCDPDTAVNVEYSCPECTVGTVADPSCTVPGDSGGPVFLNATNIGGDPIPGFTSSVVAGALKSGAGSSTCGSAWMRHTGTWDAMYTLGGFSVPTENGSWIRARRQDFDNDGVPNETDNCPVAPNPKQENCNVDAEDAKGYPRRGDACDPIPCAASDVAPPVEVVTASSNNGFVTTIQGRRYQDTFAVLPRASQEFGNGSNMGDAQDSLSVPGVGTHYSFCQRDPVHQVHCGSESIDNGFLDPAEGLPDPSRPYHLARVGPTGATSAGFTNEPVDYPQAPMDRTWHYLDDSALWEQEHWIDPVSGAVVGSGWGTNLDGRFWFHSDTSVGTAAAGSSTGYRVRPDGTTSPDDQHLSNHYFPMKPDGAFVRAHVGVLLDWPELWFPLCDPLREIWDGFGEERGPIVPLGEGLHGLPLRNGEMVDLGEHLGPALRERLDDPGVTWATAVEPMAWQGGAEEGWADQAIALAADGTDVLEVALLVDDRLVSLDDLGESVKSRGSGPPARMDAVGVYSRVEDRVFVVGGRDGEAPTGDVWMRAVRGALPWQKLALSVGPLGTVEAATYSFFDRRLWIVDHLDGQWRILRVQPATGSTDVVAHGESTGGWDWHRLILDHDGRVLLVATQVQGNRHGLVRFDAAPHSATEPVDVGHFEIRPGTLAFPPAVHARGYTYYLVEGDGYNVSSEPSFDASPSTLDAIHALF